VPFAERRPGAPPLAEALALGLVGVFFSFGGFWEASRVAGEVRDPERALPLALLLGVTCVTLVYVLTSLAFMYLVPIEGATSAVEFARRAGEAMLGLAGPPVLSAIVLLSVAPSAMALLMMAPRLYTAMSRDGLFPEALAALGSDGRTPLRATVLLAFLASAFVLAGTFQQIVAFFLCTTLVFVAMAAAGLIAIRSRERRGRNRPIAAAVPASFVLFVSAVVTIVAIARPIQALAGFGLVLLGLPARHLLMNASGVNHR
jgi:APA family basic amino acid/polyamine antiporter